MESSIRIVNINQPSKKDATSNLISIKPDTRRLILPTMEGIHMIPFHEIKHCKSDSNYCTIYLSTGQEIMFSKTLKSIEQQLPSKLFLRVHHSHLINISFIRFLATDYLLLDDDTKVPVARSRKTNVLSIIGNKLG